MNFEGALGGFQLHRLADGNRPAVHQAGLDLEAWRRVVEGDSLGVDVGESVVSRKPKCAIFGDEPMRLAITSAVGSIEAVALTEKAACHSIEPAGSECIQLLFFDAEDAEMRTDPEITVSVFQNGAGSVRKQSVFCLNPAKAIALNPEKSEFGCSGPNHVIAIYRNRTDPPMR